MDTNEQKTLFNSNRTYAGENRYKTQNSIFNKIQSSIGLYTYMFKLISHQEYIMLEI
jgi:hypothetical protein